VVTHFSEQERSDCLCGANGQQWRTVASLLLWTVSEWT